MRRASSVEEEIQRAQRESARNNMLGIKNDTIYQPTYDIGKAEYCSSRNEAQVTIIDKQNNNIVMHHDIGRVRKLRDPERFTPARAKSLEAFIYYVRYLAENMYIVGIQGGSHSLSNEESVSMFAEKIFYEPDVRKQNDRHYNRARGDQSRIGPYALGMDSNHLSCLYDRLFFCDGDKATRIVQFLDLGDLLVLDIGAGVEEAEILKRVCIHKQSRKILGESKWNYKEFANDYHWPEIYCTEDYVVLNSKDTTMRAILKTMDYMNQSKLSKEADLYDYSGRLKYTGYCQICGNRLEYVMFDGIGVGGNSLRVYFDDRGGA
jgi:hypothetical protein